jgi:hypothetical protein
MISVAYGRNQGHDRAIHRAGLYGSVFRPLEITGAYSCTYRRELSDALVHAVLTNA